MSQTAPNPSVQHQKVIIPNMYGEKLEGILHESGTREIAILCHGFRSTKETTVIANLAAALENVGISSFRFDFAGNGESEGSFQFGNYWREVDDLHAVAQHFREAKRVVAAIFGHSKGGDVVLLYASKYRDVKTVVNLSGRYDLKVGIKERLGEDYMERIRKGGFIDVKKNSGYSGRSSDFRVTEESLMDRLNTNVHEACLQIDKECRVREMVRKVAIEVVDKATNWCRNLESHDRVFTVHGSADQIIHVEDAIEFDKIVPNHKLHIIEGADHYFTDHQDDVVSVVVNFIKENLQQDKATAS